MRHPSRAGNRGFGRWRHVVGGERHCFGQDSQRGGRVCVGLLYGKSGVIARVARPNDNSLQQNGVWLAQRKVQQLRLAQRPPPDGLLGGKPPGNQSRRCAWSVADKGARRCVASKVFQEAECAP